MHDTKSLIDLMRREKREDTSNNRYTHISVTINEDVDSIFESLVIK